MTAPAASRHSVAVSRMRCSSGWVGARPVRRPDLCEPGGPSRPGGVGICARLRHAPRKACRRSARVLAIRDELAEALAALLEVAELVIAGAGRRQQHDLPPAGQAPGDADRAFEVAALGHARADPLERGADAGGVLADEVDVGAGARHVVAQRLEVLALA